MYSNFRGTSILLRHWFFWTFLMVAWDFLKCFLKKDTCIFFHQILKSLNLFFSKTVRFRTSDQEYPLFFWKIQRITSYHSWHHQILLFQMALFLHEWFWINRIRRKILSTTIWMMFLGKIFLPFHVEYSISLTNYETPRIFRVMILVDAQQINLLVTEKFWEIIIR